MPNPTQPLSEVVSVAVSTISQQVAAPTLNQGCIVGSSTVIPSVGANSRIRQYTGTAGMLTDGFSSTSPEYVEAQLYFSQTPAATYLWIGRQDLTALQTANPHTGNAGTGYVVGDIVFPTQSGASAGQLKVTTIGSGGAVTGLAIIQGSQGTGYAVASGLPTTGGTGTGLEVDITAVGETWLQAVTACRLASPLPYMFAITGGADADIEAIAAYIETAQPLSMFVYNTSEATVLNGTTGNVATVLAALSYKRTLGIYSTTQSGLYPSNAYAAGGVLGIYMGLNTGLASSAFTGKFKVIIGVAVEPLSASQLPLLDSQNINYFLSFANSYSWFQQGVTCAGSNRYADATQALDMLALDMQYSAVNTFTGNPSVPQTDPGEQELLVAIEGACDRAKSRGFIAPAGTWQGEPFSFSSGNTTVVALSTGEALSNGYLAFADSFANESSGAKQARQMMPIYVALISAGSGHSLSIGLNVQ